MPPGPHRWNHNIHYHRLVLDAVPAHARTALDVGTGNGLLAAELARRVPDVTGIDVDAPVLDSARREDGSVRWVHGDVRTHPFPPASFDVVASIATLHHLPEPEQAFARLAELTAPGGVLVVVGLARSTTPADAVFVLAGTVQHAVLSRRYGFWEHSAPAVWPPPHSYREVRAGAVAALPGCRWRHLPLWRYAVVWNAPRV
ncbi:class I SAM-dependent methyltransferase [Pseudonocardia sp. HH130630-07]|uniref:class I SAM-dependent methyltransferase n=1 Tax=Pseudonocardia sp. HH130630-07 TaxID=1690815 RepID=UPI000814B53B|nr:class I SAM-dependent methyltransferase [Pseudonocardia sp. HH130630-07]ANY06002.1 methyltransferase type 11 [Pseudonocardia sp. HH130630-07]